MKRATSVLVFSILFIIIIFSAIPAAGCVKSLPKQLNVYVWEGYLPESVADLFEKETGIKLNINLIEKNGTVFAFLKGGGKADIVMPTQSSVYMYYENDFVQALDMKNIKNYEKVNKPIKEQNWAKWDGSKMGSGDIYSIPFIFGTSGLVINTSKYTKSIDVIGWDILLDESLKGRTTSKNNNETLNLIFDLNGIPRENIGIDTSGTLEKIRSNALELKNNVLKFYTTNAEVFDLMKNEEAWVAEIWDGGGRKLSEFDNKFVFVLPETGGLGWTDTFMIPKNAENPAGANKFIDFMLRPEIAAMITQESGLNTTVDGSLELTKGINKDLYKYTDAQLANLKWSAPNLSEDVRSAMASFLEEITTVK